MTTNNTNPSNPREDELREKILKVNMLKDYNYTPKNVVLVTLDDIEEIFRELVPYTMSKLDAIKAREATMQAEWEREVIGNDEPTFGPQNEAGHISIDDYEAAARNALRAEQRARLAAQTNGEGNDR